MNTKKNACTLGWLCSFVSLFATSANAVQTELPYTWSSRYNEAGQLTGTISPAADANTYLATRYVYGSSGATKGLLLRVEKGALSAWSNETASPAAWTGFQIDVTTQYTYDTYGRKATERVIGADGQVESLVQYSYDGWNRVECKAVRMNPSVYGSLPSSACTLGAEGDFGPDRIFRYTYDNFDQVLTEERALGTDLHQTYVTNTYDGRGVLSSQTDANGNRTELRYDANWRLDRRVYPSPTSPRSVNESDYNAYDYDNNGNVTYERKRNGTSITNTYDDNNRLTFKNLSNNTYSDDVSYDYDLRGLTLSSRFGSDAGQGITNTFDGFGRLETATTNVGGVAGTLRYRYDANGNRTRITHPDDWFFEYAFDQLDRLRGIDESTAASSTASTTSLLTLDYHRGGGRWHLYRPGGATTTYLQDNVKRLESFTQDFSGTTNDLINAFDYNPANQITFLSRSNDLYAISSGVSRTGTYAPNGLNQYTSIAGQAIQYDTNGNLTNDGAVTYTYDMENRLVAASGTVDDQSVNASFLWDPLGRLSQMNVNGTTRVFLYDGDALVGESDGSTSTRYVHGDQVDEPLVQYNGSTVGPSYRRYLHADHQGSIIAQSSNTGGVLFRNAYDPYGIPRASNEGRFGFTGQAWLPELGLYHYKARMYHPKLGRFLQTDPIFYADDMNMYAYVGGDPLNNVDPSGQWCIPCVTAGVGAVVGTASYLVATAAIGGRATLGGALGAAAAGAIGGLTMNYAASAAAGGSLAGAATAIGINTAGGALAGATAVVTEAAVDDGGLPNASRVVDGAITGAALQNLAPAGNALGKVAGTVTQSSATASAGQGAARAVGELADHLVEKGSKTMVEAFTRPSPVPEPRVTPQGPSLVPASSCNRDSTISC